MYLEAAVFLSLLFPEQVILKLVMWNSGVYQHSDSYVYKSEACKILILLMWHKRVS